MKKCVRFLKSYLVNRGESCYTRSLEMKHYFNRFVNHPYFDDRPMLYLSIAIGSIALVVLVMQVIGIDAVALQVPVQYSDFEPRITRGNWWELLKFPIFTVLMTVVNMLIAVRLYRMDRLMSGFMTVATLCIVILTGIVSWAVLGLS